MHIWSYGRRVNATKVEMKGITFFAPCAVFSARFRPVNARIIVQTRVLSAWVGGVQVPGDSGVISHQSSLWSILRELRSRASRLFRRGHRYALTLPFYCRKKLAVRRQGAYL